MRPEVINRLLPLVNKLNAQIKEMYLIEKYEKKEFIYSNGTTYWWYNPERDIWMAMKSKTAPKVVTEGDSPWVYVAMAIDGKVV